MQRTVCFIRKVNIAFRRCAKLHKVGVCWITTAVGCRANTTIHLSYRKGNNKTKQQKQKFQERLAKPDFVVRIIDIVYLPASHPSGFQVYVGSEPIFFCVLMISICTCFSAFIQVISLLTRALKNSGSNLSAIQFLMSAQACYPSKFPPYML